MPGPNLPDRVDGPPPGGTGPDAPRAAWVGVAVAVLTGLVVTAPAWGPRPISGDDVMALLIRADRGLALAADLRVDGWSPDFLLGFQQFLFYGPGFTWTVGLAKVVGLGALSTAGALTVVAVAAVVAVGPAVVFLARSLGLAPRTAAVAGVLALAVDSVFGLGTSGTFGIGLVPHQLAAIAFCLALGAAARALHDPRWRWVLLAGVSVAAIVTTHLFSTVSLAVVGLPALAVVAASRRPHPGALGRLTAGGAIGAGLAGFWLVPYLAHWGDRGVVPGWAVPPLGRRLAEIVDGEVLFGPTTGWLVAAGLVWSAFVALRGHRRALVALAAPAAFLVVAHAIAVAAPGFELSPHLANRGLGYAGLLAVLGLASALAAAGRRVPVAGQPLALVLAAMVVIAFPEGPAEAVGQQPRPAPVLGDVAAVLADQVPDGARFATERDFPGEIDRLGLSHPDFWLARRSGRNTLNVFGLELSPSPAVAGIPESVSSRVAAGPEGTASLLAALRATGTTHLVTVRHDTTSTLVATPGFTPRYRSGAVGVFAVEAAEGQPGPATLVAAAPPGTTASRRHAGPGEERFELDLPRGGAVELAIGWNSRWTAVDGDGRTVPLYRGAGGVLAADLPAGPTVLTVRFGADPWEQAGIAVTLATSVGVLAAVVRRRRRSERAAAGGGPA